MKKLLLYFLIIFAGSCLNAQVGINTNNPQSDLDINGSLLVTKEFQIGNLNTVNERDENFKLLTRRSDSDPKGEVTVLDVRQIKVAPINIVDYEFANLLDDKININLQYEASKYIVAISNLQHIGGPNLKPGGNSSNIGNFVAQTYVKNGKWHLEMGNRNLPGAGSDIRYKVSLIVYDKAYFKQLNDVDVDLDGRNTGTAPSPL